MNDISIAQEIKRDYLLYLMVSMPSARQQAQDILENEWEAV